jgi:hypothetical protein
VAIQNNSTGFNLGGNKVPESKLGELLARADESGNNAPV